MPDGALTAAAGAGIVIGPRARINVAVASTRALIVFMVIASCPL